MKVITVGVFCCLLGFSFFGYSSDDDPIPSPENEAPDPGAPSTPAEVYEKDLEEKVGSAADKAEKAAKKQQFFAYVAFGGAAAAGIKTIACYQAVNTGIGQNKFSPDPTILQVLLGTVFPACYAVIRGDSAAAAPAASAAAGTVATEGIAGTAKMGLFSCVPGNHNAYVAWGALTVALGVAGKKLHDAAKKNREIAAQYRGTVDREHIRRCAANDPNDPNCLTVNENTIIATLSGASTPANNILSGDNAASTQKVFQIRMADGSDMPATLNGVNAMLRKRGIYINSDRQSMVIQGQSIPVSNVEPNSVRTFASRSSYFQNSMKGLKEQLAQDTGKKVSDFDVSVDAILSGSEAKEIIIAPQTSVQEIQDPSDMDISSGNFDGEQQSSDTSPSVDDSTNKKEVNQPKDDLNWAHRYGG